MSDSNRRSTAVGIALVMSTVSMMATSQVVSYAQPPDRAQIPKTINFAFLSFGERRRQRPMDWRPRSGEAEVELLRDFSDPDDPHQLTLLKFTFQNEPKPNQPTGWYQADWEIIARISKETRIVPLCGYPYELTRDRTGYILDRVSFDPASPLPERQEKCFTVSPEVSFGCQFKRWEIPKESTEILMETLGIGFPLIAIERIGEQSYALLEINTPITLEKRRGINSQSERTDDPLLESPEQLLIWKNCYRARVGDVVRTKQFKFIVRRIVPPDEQGRHHGWVDLELISGLEPVPVALPR